MFATQLLTTLIYQRQSTPPATPLATHPAIRLATPATPVCQQHVATPASPVLQRYPAPPAIRVRQRHPSTPAIPVRQRQPPPPASPSPTSTPPPTYRSISPSPPVYETKPYLTIDDLFMRYAPLKSICPTTARSQSIYLASHTSPPQQRRRAKPPTHLTIFDFFRMCDKYTPTTIVSIAGQHGNKDKSMEIHGRGTPSVSGLLWQRLSEPATKVSIPTLLLGRQHYDNGLWRHGTFLSMRC